MIHKIFAIHDKAASAYLPPFVIHAEGLAIRTFSEALNDPTHPFSKHPGDYTLMQLGEFDDNNGVITPLQTQKPLGNGLSFLSNNEDKDQFSLLEEVK